MPTKIKEVRPPHGLIRLMMNMPFWLYHIHPGWVVGSFFVAYPYRSQKWITHQIIVEVLQHDKVTDVYYVLSG